MNSNGEQLYMLELSVERLTLNPELPDVHVKDLLVCARFADLPQYELRVPEDKQADPTGRGQELPENPIDCSYERSCLFAKTPSCLIRAIRWSPLCLELYHRDTDSQTKSRAFLGTARVSLPTCLCNQVASSKNSSDGLPEPCVIKDFFDLIDHNEKVSGIATIVLKLSCFGSSAIQRFSLSGKSFMLEDSPLEKFLCSRACPESSKSDDKNPKDGPGKPTLKRPVSPPRIFMDSPAFNTLTTAEKLNDPKYRELVYTAYPNEPTCRCTPKDRSSHPMMCRSGCNGPCCMKLRNMDALSVPENRRADDAMADTYCVNNFLSALYTLKQDSPPCDSGRLRGGGDIEQTYIHQVGGRWSDYDTDYIWCDERRKMRSRLEGGGEEKTMGSCSCSGSPTLVPPGKGSANDNDVIAIYNACTPRATSTGATPTCICPGKDPKWPRGAAKCMNQPCMGIDCLIRAFKDAQDFVDSIGKVPGLPGLGLMDPSESPYFGRDLDKDYVPHEKLLERRKAGIGGLLGVPQATGPTTPTCTAPCSLPVGKPVDDDDRSYPGGPYVPPVPRGITVPPRLGIVREAIPVLPEVGSTIVPAKQRKKEEKKDEKTDKQKDIDAGSSALMVAEVGPCGEVRCKSRRRKPPENDSATQSATHISSKTRTGVKRGGGATNSKKSNRKTKRMSKIGTKHRALKLRANQAVSPSNKQRQAKSTSPLAEKSDYRGRGKSLGPGGDRDHGVHHSIPVSKRIMRWVYFVGDYYPGINYGHRDCIELRMRVPANMGWLWTTAATVGNLKPRIGWRPGAIGRYLYEMLQDAKENTLAMEDTDYDTEKGERGKPGTTKLDRGKMAGKSDRGRIDRGRGDRGRTAERAKSAPSRQKSATRRQKTGRTTSYQTMQKQSKKEGDEEGAEAPPTLHIHRKDGTYYVTMYPIKQETITEPQLSEPMKPLQFKIVKNKDDASIASSSTASDMEIEFSPPAAVSRYRKKPDVVHVDTQVRQQEILDTYKAVQMKKKGRRGRREKKIKKP